jgi:hypothetical protein
MSASFPDIGIQGAVMRYGVDIAIDAHTTSGGMVVYAAPLPTTVHGATATISPADRDEWWKWAAGAGLVSMAAYIVYLKVTSKK